MPFLRKIYQYFLTNDIGQCYYVDGNRMVQLTNQYVPLRQSPDGWLTQKVTRGRNLKTYGSNRSYTQPLKFVNDGARIIRWLLYNKTGIEEKLYLVVLKWNDGSDTTNPAGTYNTWYKGEIDLVNLVDISLESVTVNVMEGGLAKLLTAYENTMYQIPCDGSIPENINVKISGLKFHALITWAVAPCTINASGTVIPLTLMTEEGNDIGCVKGNPVFSQFDGGAIKTPTTTNNLWFSSIADISALTMGGYLEFNGNLANAEVMLVSQFQNRTVIPMGPIATGVQYPVNLQFDYQGGENLYLVVITTDAHPNCAILTTGVTLEFDSQFQDTNTWAIRPYDLLNLLLQKICQDASTPNHNITYTLQSNLLQQYAGLCLTSGAALRNYSNALINGTPGTVIKTCLADFFTSFNAILNACMGNQGSTDPFGENLFFEAKGYVFDSSQVTIDVEEVSNFSIAPAPDYQYSGIKIGYAEQKYSEAAGNGEFNTTSQFKTPIKKLNKDLSLISKYRADSFGIEYTRFLINSSTTTNNASDNDTFILNVDLSTSSISEVDVLAPNKQIIQQTESIGQGTISRYNSINMPTYNPPTGGGLAALFALGTISGGTDNAIIYQNNNASLRATINVTMSISQIGEYIAQNVPTVWPTTFDLMVGQGSGAVAYNTQKLNLQVLTTANLTFTATVDLNFNDAIYIRITPDNYSFFYIIISSIRMAITTSLDKPVYSLLRKTYDSAPNGIINPDFAYNIEDLTPMRMLSKWGNFIRGGLSQMPTQNLKFQQSDKNPALSTTLNGVTVTENSDVAIGSMNSNVLFLPYILKFTTRVPMTFDALVNLAANGHIRGTIMGVPFYGFPITVSVQPTLEEAQEWELLCSPLTNLADLWDLDLDGLFFLDMPQNSSTFAKACPLRFVRANTEEPDYDSLGAPDMDDDFEVFQFREWPMFTQKDGYIQKWQNNDIISLQLITNGLSDPLAMLTDGGGNQIGNSFGFFATPDPAARALGLSVFQCDIPLTDIDAGIYFMVVNVGIGDAQQSWISEPIQIAAKWPGTRLCKYKHTTNKLDTIFSQGYNPSIRFDGWIAEYTPELTFATYKDEPGDLEMLNAIPARKFTLHVGRDRGVADWMIEKLNAILGLNTVTIGTRNWTLAEDSKWTPSRQKGWPLAKWTVMIQEADNRFSVTQTSDSTAINSELIVAWPMQTAGFGDGSNASGIVEVTQID